MIKRTIEKHNVVFYDSPNTLPIRRYATFNKHFMIAMEVGDSIEDYDRRMSRALGYIVSDDSKSALTEFTNQRQCLHNALEQYSPKGMALATLIYSIDGKRYSNFNEDGLNAVLDKLEAIGYTKAMQEEDLQDVKKK